MQQALAQRGYQAPTQDASMTQPSIGDDWFSQTDPGTAQVGVQNQVQNQDQGGAPSPTPGTFGGNIIPQAKPGTLDEKLSNLPGVLGGITSGIYNAGKGIFNLGKDAAVDTFELANHPIDSIGKIGKFVGNEVFNQGEGNDHLDAVGQLIQSTLGSKGALGVGQQVGNAFNDATGQTTDTFSGSKLAGNTLNTILTAITGGKGTLTGPVLESSVQKAITNGIITEGMGQALIKYGTGFVGKSLESGTAGAGFQVASNLQEGRPVDENIGQAFATGAAVPGVLKAGEKAIGAAQSTVNKVRNPTSAATNVEDLAGAITQGEKGDRAAAIKAFSDIDVSKVKTYDDLVTTLNSKIDDISENLGSALDTNPELKKLDALAAKVRFGDTVIKHNYVEDAINQLKNYYEKTSDPAGVAKVTAFENKARTQGLSTKEINDLAVIHGQELHAFNANGQLASGLSKQSAENTRQGLKTTAREMFDNPVFKETDAQLSNLINTRNLVDKVSDKVTALRQKIQDRSLPEKVGRALGTVIDYVGLGTPKAMMEYFTKRGEGAKILNAIDMEKALSGNLLKIQNALKGSTEQDIISKLQEVVHDEYLRRNQMLALPAGDASKQVITKNSGKAVPLTAPKSKLADTFSNDLVQNARIDKNTLKLPAPSTRIVVPNKQGTPNTLGRPYNPNEKGDVGGMRQR